jgi:hypothetical protein
MIFQPIFGRTDIVSSTRTTNRKCAQMERRRHVSLASGATIIPCVCGIQPCRGRLRTTSGICPTTHPVSFSINTRPPSRRTFPFCALLASGGGTADEISSFGTLRLAPCSTVLIPAAKFVRLFWSKHPRTLLVHGYSRTNSFCGSTRA